MKAANSLQKIIARKKQGDARTVVDQAQVLKLSERDSLRVLELLKNPPAPSGRLMAAAQSSAQFTADIRKSIVAQSFATKFGMARFMNSSNSGTVKAMSPYAGL